MTAVMAGVMGFVAAGRAGAAGEPDAASPAFLGEPPSSTRDAPKERGVQPPGESAQPTKEPTAQPPAPPQRTRVPVDPGRFGEGWRKTVRLADSPVGPGDAYDVWVEDGWLQVKRYNEEGELDWHVVLARASSGVPTITVGERQGAFEVSCRDGRYFIRDTLWALRCLREPKDAGGLLPKAAFFDGGFQSKGYAGAGAARGPHLVSGWQDERWFYVACGPDRERFDCVVRLNPVAKSDPGYGFQGMSGLAYVFHGKAWAMDDGELLVAARTLQAAYEMELAREKIRKNLPGNVPPEIDAEKWLNTPWGLSWGSLKGKVVLLDFWATWCGPCVEKLPAIQQLADTYGKRGLVVIGVHSAQNSEGCEEFVKTKGVSFPVAVDSGKTEERYAVTSLPTYFLIDKTGKVAVGYTSRLPDAALIEELLEP
jgi:thiol-disulfide isomerase/thioredoxin